MGENKRLGLGKKTTIWVKQKKMTCNKIDRTWKKPKIDRTWNKNQKRNKN